MNVIQMCNRFISRAASSGNVSFVIHQMVNPFYLRISSLLKMNINIYIWVKIHLFIDSMD